MFRVWSPQPSIAVSPLADFTPSPNTRIVPVPVPVSIVGLRADL